MMTPEQARQRCQDTRKSYAATRRYKDALWTMQVAYNEGEQWGSIANQSGNLAVQGLKSQLDMHGARRVRITINEIGRHVEKVASMTNPQHIGATVLGPCETTDTYTRTATKVLQAALKRMDALQIVRGVNPDRHVLGSAGIRQVLRMVGPRRTVRKAQGQRPELSLGQYQIDWAPVMPWELTRSPAATSVAMARDEETVGHEKPRTVAWMARHYNGFALPDDSDPTEYGKVAHFLEEIRHLTGPGHAPLMTEAKDPAVLACEYWLTDPDRTAEIYTQTGRYVRWPWMFVGYIDPARNRQEILPVPRVGNKGLLANPFNGLAISMLHYRVGTEAMWGVGMPWQLMQWQDFSNIAYTWLAEALQQSASKWMYQHGTVENPQRAFNNDQWQPIPFKRKGQNDVEPKRIPGAPTPQMASDIVGMAPTGMERVTNLAQVQMGQGYRRDGSGKAYETLLREAESVPEDRITSDELTLGSLLCDTIIGTIRHGTLGMLQKLTGGTVGDGFLRELKRDDPADRIAEVRLTPTTMRPKTLLQRETRYVGLIEAQVLTPEQGVREATLAGVEGLDTSLENASAKQRAEIERMRDGDVLLPDVLENHVYHIQATRDWIDEPNALDRDEQWVERVRQHSILHQQAQMETAGMAVGQAEPLSPEMPGRASPPANMGMAQGNPAAGPAGSGLRIA